MNKFYKSLIIMGLAFVMAIAIVYAGDEESQVIGDYWYEMSLMGQKMGYMHQVIEKTKYQGKDCYKRTTDDVTKIKNDDGNIQERSETSVSYTDLEFTPLYAMKKKQDGQQKQTTEIIISSDKIIIKETLNDDTPEETTIPFEPGVIFGADGLLLKHRGLLKVGASASFKSISDDTKKLATETVKVLREEKIKIRNQEVASFLIQSTNSEMPGLAMNVNLDAEGTELKMEAAGIKVILTSERKAKKFGEIGILSSYIKTDINIPFSSRIAQLDINIILAEEFEDVIPNNEYQQVEGGKKRYKVTLKSLQLDVVKGPEIPIKDEAVKKYLEPTLLVQSQDPAIAKLAREIAKDEKDSLKLTRLISSWIYKNIKKEESITASKSAKETLADKSGDCTEHAVLFCALARAAGLPARNINGIMYSSGIFGYHAWNEVYLGKWMPVDTTLNRVGIPACYIKLGEDDEGEEETLAMTRMIKLIGKTSIKIKSFKDNTGTAFDLAMPGGYIITQGNSYENGLCGIKLIKPDGWTIGAGAKGEIILSTDPPGSAVVIVPFDMNEELTPPLFESFLKGATSKFTKVTTQPVRESAINGQQTMQCTYTGDMKDNSFKNRLVVKQGNGKTFMIALTSLADKFDEAEKDFQSILDGIDF